MIWGYHYFRKHPNHLPTFLKQISICSLVHCHRAACDLPWTCVSWRDKGIWCNRIPEKTTYRMFVPKKYARISPLLCCQVYVFNYRVYINIYLEPVCPLFWWLIPPKQSLSNQTRVIWVTGISHIHRYVYISTCILQMSKVVLSSTFFHRFTPRIVQILMLRSPENFHWIPGG